MSGTLRLSILIEAIDRASRPMAALQARLGGVAANILRVGQATQRLAAASGVTVLAGAFGNLAGRAGDAASAIGGAAGRLALLAGGGAFAFNRLFVRGAADFERYRITLETVMGSAEAAQRRLTELNDFASRTPFDVAGVVEAGVALQTLGIRGAAADRALTAVGDAAAVFGTRLPEAMTAFSAALRGEMDPIERFGVQARTEGNRLIFQWEENGRRMRATVDKNNRAAIAQVASRALEGIAGGGMQRLSSSWDGMVSNLMDAWSNFRRAVAEAGPFDWLKDQLRDLLALIARLEADGTLARWAQETGAAITRAFQAIRDFVVGTDETPGALARLQRIFERISTVLGPVVNYFGGMETAFVAIGLVLAGPLIASLAALAGAVAALGAAILLTPAGWFLAAAAGLAALGVAVVANWDAIAGGFSRIGDEFRRFRDSEQVQWLRDALGGAGAFIADAWERVTSVFSGMGGFISRVFAPEIEAVRTLVGWVQRLLDLLPSLPSFGGGAEAGPTPRSSGAGNALRRRSIYGDPALPGAAEGGPMPPADPVRVNAGLDVTIRLPDGLSASVAPRGGEMDVRTEVRRGTLAMPVP